MSKTSQDQAEIQRKLWDEISESRFGMLGLADDARQVQPMTAFPEPHEAAIWFFTKADTDIAKAVVGGADGIFIIQSKDQQLQAAVAGQLDLLRDAGRIDRYWNPMVAAWFPDGRDDPSLVLLRLSARHAEVWLSKAGPIRLAWEVAKANTTHAEPDVGKRSSLDLGADRGLPRWR